MYKGYLDIVDHITVYHTVFAILFKSCKQSIILLTKKERKRICVVSHI